MRKVIFLVIISTLSFLSCTSLTDKGIFKSNWNSTGSRTWIGPEYWTNPLQDWQVDKGRLCCSVAGANRSIHLLTHSLESESGPFETKVTIGVPEMTLATKADGWGGFIIGAKGNTFRPKVFAKGKYKVEAGEPGTDQWKVLENISSVKEVNSQTIRIDL